MICCYWPNKKRLWVLAAAGFDHAVSGSVKSCGTPSHQRKNQSSLHRRSKMEILSTKWFWIFLICFQKLFSNNLQFDYSLIATKLCTVPGRTSSRHFCKIKAHRWTKKKRKVPGNSYHICRSIKAQKYEYSLVFFIMSVEQKNSDRVHQTFSNFSKKNPNIFFHIVRLLI